MARSSTDFATAVTLSTLDRLIDEDPDVSLSSRLSPARNRSGN
jgi:hypothetical protein